MSRKTAHPPTLAQGLAVGSLDQRQSVSIIMGDAAGNQCCGTVDSGPGLAHACELGAGSSQLPTAVDNVTILPDITMEQNTVEAQNGLGKQNDNLQTLPIGITTTVGCNGDGTQPAASRFDKVGKPPRMPYASLFKTNRMAKAEHKLDFYAPGTNCLKFTYDDIDSVEKTYGICLLGFVLGGKPPTSALVDLVRRWGKDIHFQTNENGWIVFTFPANEARDRILSGGPYLVYGYHLFLKEMPRCFRFSEEDMHILPSWIQVHGLPPDCWNHFILSNIMSELGTPIHMDLLTHGRKRIKFARVLVEVNAAVPKLDGITIDLPTGPVQVQFIYEIDIKFCGKCKSTGHEVSSCPKDALVNIAAGTSPGPTTTHRYRSKSMFRMKSSTTKSL